jgi:hypothetical protein
MKLPALKAHHGTFHRQDVLSITKPAEGLKGGEVGIFWDQEIGLEILRRVNAYPKLVEALRQQCARWEELEKLHSGLDGWKPAEQRGLLCDLNEEE